MHTARLLRSCWVWAALLVLATPALCADDKPDSSLEIVQFKTPAGWKATERPGEAARSFMAPDSDATQQAMIVIFLSQPLDRMDFRATFDATVKQMTGNAKVLESGQVASTKTR